ncbi:MAG: hypothetical protein IKU94_03570, partial [Bacteroidaceae bacterium]|nr:hypothetical protein [Bacteroidaceae bacterium]
VSFSATFIAGVVNSALSNALLSKKSLKKSVRPYWPLYLLAGGIVRVFRFSSFYGHAGVVCRFIDFLHLHNCILFV